ncbi:MAG: hypothetical protein AMS15_05965 [Planctomycetes bacterium DG_23]|nr:MAG: hypothetical protein AMS15_05965 [Planctomycetes bacterium DG_23]
MRKLSKALTGLNWVIVVADGTFILVWFLWPRIGELFLQTWEENWQFKSISALVALAVVALNIIWLDRKITKRKYATHIPFANPKGEVAVSVGALEDTLRKAGLSVGEVRDMKVSVIAEERPEVPIRVVGVLVLEEGRDVPQVTAMVQDALSRRFREVVAQEGEVHYEIRVQKFRGAKGEAEEEEEVFRGPQYPVEQ